MAKQQRSAAVEILTTEIKYVNDLRTIVEVFAQPLRADASSSSGESGAKQSEVEAIFSNVESILLFNEELLKALSEALGPLLASMEDPAASSTPVEAATLASVGEIFEDLGPYLRVYTSYVNGHSRSSETHLDILKRQTKSNKYAQFLANCVTGNEERVRGRSLLDFLIMPIQRIPRYRLLLEELLKRTSPDDYPEEDYRALELGLQRIADVANVINERLRDFENREKVASLQTRFGGESADLIEAHRVFVKEGYLKKISRRGPADYYFVLFNDILIYGAPAGIGSVMAAVGAGGETEVGTGGNSIADSTSVFKLKRKFNLAEISLSESFSPGEPNQFEVKSPEKSFVVIAPDAATKADWYDKISACISASKQQQQQQQQAGNGPEEERGEAEERPQGADGAFAPIWIPNSEAPVCMICAGKFTTFSRRHHCRNCGHVVCERCSPHRWYLPNIHKTKPQRICSDCYLSIRADLEANGFENAEVGPRPAAPVSSSRTGGFYDLFTVPIGTSISSLNTTGSNNNNISKRSTDAQPSTTSTPSTATNEKQQQQQPREASSYLGRGGGSSAAATTAAAGERSNAKAGEAGDAVVDTRGGGELPRNWVMLKNENGQVYYWNKMTDLTQFEMPRKFGVLDRFPATTTNNNIPSTTAAKTIVSATPTLASLPAKDRKSAAHKQLLAQTQAASPNRVSSSAGIGSKSASSASSSASPAVNDKKATLLARRSSAHAGPSFSERLAALNAAGMFKDATVAAAASSTVPPSVSSSKARDTRSSAAASRAGEESSGGRRKQVTFGSKDSTNDGGVGKGSSNSPKSGTGSNILSSMHRELLAVGTRFLSNFSSSSSSSSTTTTKGSSSPTTTTLAKASKSPTQTISVKKAIADSNKGGLGSSSPAKEKRKASYVATTSVRELSKRYNSPPNFAELDKEGGSPSSNETRKKPAAVSSSSSSGRPWGGKGSGKV